MEMLTKILWNYFLISEKYRDYDYSDFPELEEVHRRRLGRIAESIKIVWLELIRLKLSKES